MMVSNKAEKAGRIVNAYIKAKPTGVKVRTVIIAGTNKLMRVLLSVSPEDVSVASAVEVAISVVKDAKESVAT